MKKNIVIIGGGNGSATSIRALKSYSDVYNLTALITMSDSGGSSGRLKKDLEVLPPGDILRACLAMSRYDYRVLKPIFNKNRFEGISNLEGHSLGNVFLARQEHYTGSFVSGVKALLQVLEGVGTVYPITIENSELCVQMKEGAIHMGEKEIDRPKCERVGRIERAWLQPCPHLYKESQEALEHADIIILGPGSLYCSIVAPLLVEGVVDSIRKSKAQIIYVVGNAFESNGELGPAVLSEFVNELERYLPRKLDKIVYNNHKLSKKEIEYYQNRNWNLIKNDMVSDKKVVHGDYEKKGSGFDVEKLGKILKELIDE